MVALKPSTCHDQAKVGDLGNVSTQTTLPLSFLKNGFCF